MHSEARPFQEGEDSLRSRGLDFIDSIQAVVRYDDASHTRKVITQFKYYHSKGLYKDLGLFMYNHMSLAHTVLCPVPLHWTRRLQRGFNQSELLAKEMGRHASLPVEHLLKRVRSTGHQAWRGREERLTAVQNAFRVCSESLPQHVTLVDDLSTTGATLDACAQALKKAGVRRVDACVIALA